MPIKKDIITLIPIHEENFVWKMEALVCNSDVNRGKTRKLYGYIPNARFGPFLDEYNIRWDRAFLVKIGDHIEMPSDAQKPRSKQG